LALIAVAVAVAAGCGGESEHNTGQIDASSATGGAPSEGGAAAASAAAAASDGGASGTANTELGGRGGGAPGIGGSAGTATIGGAPGVGGSKASGGDAGSGAADGPGGSEASGGTPASGGAESSGGAGNAAGLGGEAGGACVTQREPDVTCADLMDALNLSGGDIGGIECSRTGHVLGDRCSDPTFGPCVCGNSRHSTEQGPILVPTWLCPTCASAETYPPTPTSCDGLAYWEEHYSTSGCVVLNCDDGRAMRCAAETGYPCLCYGI
jgi:hypothetical protein